MKTLILFKIIFSLVGLGLLGGAAFMLNDTRAFLAQAYNAQGVVVDLIPRRGSEGGTTYAPKFQFNNAQGQSFTVENGPSSSPPAYERGEQVRVLYVPGKEAEAKIDSFFSLWFGSLMMGILGSVFAAIGLGMVFWSAMNKRKQAYLKVHGQPLMTQLQGVERNTRLKVNGRSPWLISCQWQNPKDQKMYIFKSDNIWFDPSDYINDETITVLVDRENYKRYYVDISFLPELAD